MKKGMPTHSYFFGAGDGARTRYLHLGKVALYQMSYTRIVHRCCSALMGSPIPLYGIRKLVPPVGIAFLRKSHGGSNAPPARL